MKPTILIAEDDQHTREGLKWALEDRSKWNILTAPDGGAALEEIRGRTIDLLITDLKMPKMDGMELIQQTRRVSPETQIVILTGYGAVETAVAAMKLGVRDYMTKPFNPEELSQAAERILRERMMKPEAQTKREAADARRGFGAITGVSEPMARVFEQARRAATARSSVLLAGESGTGKELVAGAIHYHSPRAGRPFIKINCGALTPTLLESELFGHEKGAFTHAIRQKPGAFEMADGGSLFLDEIAETTPEFQVKLLRVLQEQEFMRVGGTRPVQVDVRIIAATNRDLDAMTREGAFREDLFYRLNVVKIELPPLRDRRDDIALLAETFLKEFGLENGRPPMRLAPKALALLRQFNWPGNVRQLRNVIERLVVMSTGEVVQAKALPAEVREAAAPAHSDSPEIALAVGATLAEIEREAIRATLLECGGNRAKTARVLGIGRKTLYRKIDQYKLE